MMNMALLAKLGWRLLQKPNSIWSRIMRAKYGGNVEDVTIFEAKQNASHIWKGMVWSSKLIKRGLRWLARNRNWTK